VKVNRNLFTIMLAPGQGDQGGALFSPAAPFPSKSLYWGGGGQQ
jgi:hypothetical protein